MSDTLYNTAILRLATNIPHAARLSKPQGSASKRSPICGSRVTADVVLGPDGKIVEFGQEVRACALGQASAALFGARVIGLSPQQIAEASDALTAWLASESGLPDWEGLEVLTPALPHKARHASIRLAFEAAAEAAALAASTRADA